MWTIEDEEQDEEGDAEQMRSDLKLDYCILCFFEPKLALKKNAWPRVAADCAARLGSVRPWGGGKERRMQRRSVPSMPTIRIDSSLVSAELPRADASALPPSASMTQLSAR